MIITATTKSTTVINNYYQMKARRVKMGQYRNARIKIEGMLNKSIDDSTFDEVAEIIRRNECDLEPFLKQC